jgi:hypothetical protein
MKTRYTLLLAAILFIFPGLSFADSTDASGYYQVTGTMTMTGAIIGPCGASPCVETLDFSVLIRATSFDNFGTLSYTNRMVISPGVLSTFGPGVTSSSGPITGPWTVGVWQGYSGSFTGFYFISSSVPDLPGFNPSEIDAAGFNSPTGLPHSFTGPAFFYSCAGLPCEDFGFQATGTQSITVTQTPEPSSAMLLAVAGLGFLAFSLAKRNRAARKRCTH